MRRVLILMGIFGVLTFAVLFGKLWQLQVVQHEELEKRAINQQTREISATASRGTIYDTNGAVLAISGSVQNVVLSPRDLVESIEDSVKEVDEFKNKRSQKAIEAEKSERLELAYDTIATGLAEILDLEEEDIRKRLQKTYSAYEVLAKKVEDDVADRVRGFIVDNDLSRALYLTSDSKRYYPYGTMAAQVIGFTNAYNVGVYGLEAKYNGELSGEDGLTILAKNARGTEMPSAYSSFTDAVDGYNVQTTIDSTIQMYAEKAVEEGIQKFDVTNGGFCVVMDPKTGAVLAMASYPDYDPNDYNAIVDVTETAKLARMRQSNELTQEEYEKAVSEVQFRQWNNKCLNTSYEPGSTFKPIVVAAALEEGVISENSHFSCSGAVEKGDWVIRCSARRGHGGQNLRKAVMNSCNPALIRIGELLTADKFYQYWQDFGFTSSTGIELPGEAPSVFWDENLFLSPAGETELATASFGQRFTTTPIKLITALSAVINGGHLMEPYVVQSVTDQDGNVVSYHEPTEVRQVVSQETSDTVRSIMESVVGERSGTGHNAAVAGYRIGGKTGSSQTLDSKDHIIVSFLGFAPADDPEIIVLLAYDWPEPVAPGANKTADGVYISGGSMACPMAGELIAHIMDYLGYQKSGVTSETTTGITMPQLNGNTVATAQETLSKLGLNCRTVGEGEAVTDQAPTAGSMVPQGSTVVLYLGAPRSEDTVLVPDLSNMNYDQAKAALEALGLYLNVTGDTEGVVFSQTITPDTRVEVGTMVEVRFATPADPETGMDSETGNWAGKKQE